MPKHKKHFIDKKNAISFKLVNRSQRDPLLNNESEHVLAPIAQKGGRDADDRLQVQEKYGIYFDDDYDYLQHLKSVNVVTAFEPIQERYRVSKCGNVVSLEDGQSNNEQLEVKSGGGKILLPATVFESPEELAVGILDLGISNPGPHPDWDPDVVAALDEDFDYDNPENLLDDDFILQANADYQSNGVETVAELFNGGRHHLECSDNVDDNDCDDADLDVESQFSDVERKSHFTEYSMSSSVMHRTKGLQLVDDIFEKLYEDYEECNIGDLAHDENIGGHLNSEGDRLKQLALEYQSEIRNQKKVFIDNAAIKEVEEESADSDDAEDTFSNQIPNYPDQYCNVDYDKNAVDNQDCESVLSQYSNIFNHPKLIEKPKKHRLMTTTKQLFNGEGGEKNCDTASVVSAASKLSFASVVRPPGESSEERRERKGAVKAARKARREEKKANKLAFKTIEKQQNIQLINCSRSDIKL